MKKFLFATIALTLLSSNTAFSAPEDSCSVTCYQESPTCYATADKKGCIDISYVKPKGTKNSYSCEKKGCSTKTTYENGKATTTTHTNNSTSTSTVKEQ